MIKEIAIKRMMIKIKKYILLKDKIEKKSQFSKRTKKIKRIRIKIDHKK